MSSDNLADIFRWTGSRPTREANDLVATAEFEELYCEAKKALNPSWADAKAIARRSAIFRQGINVDSAIVMVILGLVTALTFRWLQLNISAERLFLAFAVCSVSALFLIECVVTEGLGLFSRHGYRTALREAKRGIPSAHTDPEAVRIVLEHLVKGPVAKGSELRRKIEKSKNMCGNELVKLEKLRAELQAHVAETRGDSTRALFQQRLATCERVTAEVIYYCGELDKQYSETQEAIAPVLDLQERLSAILGSFASMSETARLLNLPYALRSEISDNQRILCALREDCAQALEKLGEVEKSVQSSVRARAEVGVYV